MGRFSSHFLQAESSLRKSGGNPSTREGFEMMRDATSRFEKMVRQISLKARFRLGTVVHENRYHVVIRANWVEILMNTVFKGSKNAKM